ncbi:hypothetical protein TWF506_005532 [Arthrobotrys conoides]|uniref:Uncharacterized protein n=1 Tax=Arthrobotrys conoides TaxID=74498 RepID=A0AAN8NED6_9PEZI
MLFVKNFVICAIALAVPTLATLNVHHTSAVTKMTQMRDKDIAARIYVDGITGTNPSVDNTYILNAIKNSVIDLESVYSLLGSGGQIGTGQITDANLLAGAFGFVSNSQTYRIGIQI